MLLGIASSRRYARITALTHILAQICATKESQTKSFSTNIGTISKNMPTNFERKRYKPKLDIVEKPENQVHELTDSNGAPGPPPPRVVQSSPSIPPSQYRRPFSSPKYGFCMLYMTPNICLYRRCRNTAVFSPVPRSAVLRGLTLDVFS